MGHGPSWAILGPPAICRGRVPLDGYTKGWSGLHIEAGGHRWPWEVLWWKFTRRCLRCLRCLRWPGISPDLYLSFGIRKNQVLHGFTWFYMVLHGFTWVFTVLPVSVKPIKSKSNNWLLTELNWGKIHRKPSFDGVSGNFLNWFSD